MIEDSEKALFKAAMFDFDGTVTEKGVYTPSQKMADTLVKLAQRMPIAFCTGRQLESFVNHGLNSLIEEIKPEMLKPFLENLCLMAENGSIGYYFDMKKNKFEEFYRISWPKDFIDKEKLKLMLLEAIKDYGYLHHSEEYPSHRVSIVLTTLLASIPPEERDINEVYRLSGEIFKKTIELLEKLDPDYEKFVHVGNSGIGVLITPANGDKDTGIKKFAEFLKEKRNISFDEKAREILVAGDSHQRSGNDYYFLKGDFGTPFTVGEADILAPSPKPVLDKNGKKLLNSKGTIYLIQSIL